MISDTDARAAVVLAGGASRRFGSDKTRAELHGRSLLERVVQVVAPLVGELVVVGPWAPSGCRQVLEPERFQGPLAAMAFGLDHVAAPVALVLGGDHPLLEPRLLRELLARAGRDTAGGFQAVVPLGPTGPEPLVGCYRHTVADSAGGLLAEGRRSLRALLEVIEVDWMPEAEWRPFDPGGNSFLDIDHREDLDRLARRSDSRADPRPDPLSDPER